MQKQPFVIKSKIQQSLDKKEKELLEKQRECHHSYWVNKCSVCLKILASDHHINIHTGKLKSNPKIAIVKSLGQVLTSKEIECLNQLKYEYDEIIILVGSNEEQILYESLSLVDRTEKDSLKYLKKKIQKYRSEDMSSMTCVLYPDTNQDTESFEKECKSLNITRSSINILL